MAKHQEQEYKGKWQVTMDHCHKCGHKNTGVHPVTCEYLECAICGHMNPAPFIDSDGIVNWPAIPDEIL